MASDFKLIQSKSGEFFGDFNDLVIENYDIKLIDGRQKIQQQIVKYILTEKGSTPLFPEFGTNVIRSLNNKTTTLNINDIRNDILFGIKYTKDQNTLNGDELNIDTLINMNLEIVNSRQLDITIDLKLTDGSTLQVVESAMGN
jgi:hypothetical protein